MPWPPCVAPRHGPAAYVASGYLRRHWVRARKIAGISSRRPRRRATRPSTSGVAAIRIAATAVSMGCCFSYRCSCQHAPCLLSWARSLGWGSQALGSVERGQGLLHTWGSCRRRMFPRPGRVQDRFARRVPPHTPRRMGTGLERHDLHRDVWQLAGQARGQAMRPSPRDTFDGEHNSSPAINSTVSPGHCAGCAGSPPARGAARSGCAHLSRQPRSFPPGSPAGDWRPN